MPPVIHRSTLLLILLMVVTISVAAPTTPPNILFILADDLGYGDLSCYGAQDLETPHLDRLATEGVRFTDFYANGPVCSPTRVAFLTGRYQQRLGIDNALKYQEMGRGLPTDGKTIADALGSAGYLTGLSGKWHVGYDHERQPLQQGFHHFFGLLGGNHHYFQHMDRIGVHDLWLGNETIRREGSYTTDLITEDAIAFIERSAGRPFFLYLSHPAPHFPWQGPDDAKKDIRPNHPSWQSGDRETCIAMVEHMDAAIGRVLARLDELGLRDNTLVVFSSDNGGHTWSSNEPLRGEKGTAWEGGIRVPCIARWPGVIPPGQTSTQVAITMDWTATFRRMAGLDADPVGEDGMDLLPILTGAASQERTLFWRRRSDNSRKVAEEARAVRQGNWKLIEEATGDRHLFDLADDIGESTNLAEQHPARVADLSRALDNWETEMNQ